MSVTQVNVSVPGNHLMAGLLGHRDEHLRLIERSFPETDIHVRGNEITVAGQDAEQVGRLFEELVVLLQQGQPLDRAERCAARSTWSAPTSARARCSPTRCCAAPRAAPCGRSRPARSATSTPSARNVITFGIGPAGTGKSWLAVAMAVQALQAKQVQRIILTRPAVEAGERLGFLPGDLMAKVDPYLRPLYDALYDMVEPEGAQQLLERQTVEVAPLAFMRGRTLNNSFIILDEAQNTTPEQMKMFLTRIGFGSKVVVTGDVTQVDVPGGRSGLVGPRAHPHRHRRAGLRAPDRRPTSCATRSSPTSSPPTSRPATTSRCPPVTAETIRMGDPARPDLGRRSRWAATASSRSSWPTSRRGVAGRRRPLGRAGRGRARGRGRAGPRRAEPAVRRRGRHRRAQRASSSASAGPTDVLAFPIDAASSWRSTTAPARSAAAPIARRSIPATCRSCSATS